MFTKYGLALLAIAGLGLGVFTVYQGQKPADASVPLSEPPTRPVAERMVSGSGIVEAQMENIPIGTNVPGVVTRVFVKKGQLVKQDEELFRVDDRELNAQLRIKEAELAAAQAQLHKLQAAPRPEDVPPAQAAVDEAKARLNDTEAAMARPKLFSPRWRRVTSIATDSLTSPRGRRSRRPWPSSNASSAAPGRKTSKWPRRTSRLRRRRSRASRSTSTA
ncbi:MAG: biotin/lipoyl-binding protein [Isosphaeraceae bacterium]